MHHLLTTKNQLNCSLCNQCKYRFAVEFYKKYQTSKTFLSVLHSVFQLELLKVYFLANISLFPIKILFMLVNVK